MCLTILKKKHRNLISGKYTPIRLKKDLVVYKLLNKEGDRYVTPFQKDIVKFIDGKAILLPINEGRFAEVYFNDITKKISKTHHAYHAYTKNDIAKANTRGADKVFRAVIPAGSLVYYGENYDICSNQMIILQVQ